MKTFLDRILKGQLPTHHENRVYRLFNILMIVGIVIVFIIAMHLLYIKAYQGFYVCITEVGVFSFLFVLHVKGHYSLSRYLFFIIAISAQVYGSLFHGENGGFDFFFFITAIFPVLFFEKKWQYLSLFLLSLSGFILVKNLYGVVSPIAPFEKREIVTYYLVAAITMFLIYLLFRLFKSDHLKYEQNLNNQKQEITQQKEKLITLKDELEKLLESRTQRVEEQDENIRKYADMNAHGIRSPLARILGLINLTDMEDMSNDETRKFYMKELKVNAQELDDIISEMNEVLFQGTKD
jgi:signal transduction histidine kinase